MAITRSQIARQLMQEGGVPRQGYFLGKLVKKIKDDIIPNELKTDLGKAATAAALGYGFNRFGIPKTSGISGTGENIGKGSISNIFKGFGIGGGKNQSDTADAVKSGIGSIFQSPRAAGAEDVGFDRTTGLPLPIPTDDKGFLAKTADFLSKDRLGTGKSIADLILSPQALALGSGLLAGAFTKDEEDPLYTGQDVGLNLADIGKLANISDPKTASAIGLRFSPDVEARKFTPAEMAATYAANVPADFTQEREQAQDGGMMGDQKDFEEFLQDMMNRDKQMLQDRIMEDFEKFMKRKRMMENLPQAKDGGIMKAKPKKISMEPGQENTLEQIYFDLIDAGMSPDEAAKKAREIYMNMSSGMANGGPIDPDYLGIPPVGLGTGARPGGVPLPNLGDYDSRGMMKKKKKKDKKKKRDKKAEGGMMDMGGMEMDLRGGGFVPMGRAEKADDVPARLSKNEFVFTADAVRAAGGGDVDKGADKMYATMKKLEDRVA